MHAEVPTHQIERDVGGVADGRDVARAVPGGSYPEGLAHDRHLAARRESAGLRDVDADIVDQAVGDERAPFVRRIEKFAHGDRRRALLADQAEPLVVLGRERVLEEEELELFHVLAKLHGLRGADALMHVVEEFHFLAQLFAALFKHLERAADVDGRLVHGLGVQRARLGGGAAARAVTRHTGGHADLHAHMAEPLRHVLAGVVDELGDFGAARVAVAVRRLAAFPAQQLVHRQPALAALDIPQSLVHAADGVVQHRAVAPVRRVVHGLPKIVDTVSRAADEERLQIFFDGGDHQIGALRERAAAIAVQASLIGENLHHHEPESGGSGGDHLHVRDLGRGQSTLGASGGFLRGGVALGKRAGGG